jgi:hypothetical protein
MWWKNSSRSYWDLNPVQPVKSVLPESPTYVFVLGLWYVHGLSATSYLCWPYRIMWNFKHTGGVELNAAKIFLTVHLLMQENNAYRY